MQLSHWLSLVHMFNPAAGSGLRVEKLFPLKEKKGLLNPFLPKGKLGGKDKCLLGYYYFHFTNKEAKA